MVYTQVIYNTKKKVYNKTKGTKDERVQIKNRLGMVGSYMDNITKQTTINVNEKANLHVIALNNIAPQKADNIKAEVLKIEK